MLFCKRGRRFQFPTQLTLCSNVLCIMLSLLKYRSGDLKLNFQIELTVDLHVQRGDTDCSTVVP